MADQRNDKAINSINSINTVFETVKKVEKDNCKVILAEKSPSGMSLSKWQLRVFLYVPQHQEHNVESDKIYYFKLNSETEKSFNNGDSTFENFSNNLHDPATRNLMLDLTFNKYAGFKLWQGPFKSFEYKMDKKTCKQRGGDQPVTILQFKTKFEDTKKLRDICINGKSNENGVTSLREAIESKGHQTIIGGRKRRTRGRRGRKSRRVGRKTRRRVSKKSRKSSKKSHKRGTRKHGTRKRGTRKHGTR